MAAASRSALIGCVDAPALAESQEEPADRCSLVACVQRGVSGHNQYETKNSPESAKAWCEAHDNGLLNHGI
jgi:hypothetical protein